MSTYTPYGSQAWSVFPFNSLPPEIRLRIYDKLLPEAIIFQVNLHARRPRWPRNPLAGLARCFPQFQTELNVRMYSSTRFIFYDSRYTQNRDVRSYGYEIAAKFFARIGPTNLSYVKRIYCHIHSKEFSANSPDCFNVLSLMASADPPRKIRELDLSFTRTSHVKPFEGAPEIRRRCFQLHGFTGLEITLISSSTKDKISLADLNAGIAKYRDPGPPVNFLTILPAELRIKIFRHLVPIFRDCNPNRRTITSDVPGWVSVNRQMSAEICSLMYSKCHFEFCMPLSQPKNSPKSEGLRFIRFLRQIGKKNASQIRSITIRLYIYPNFWVNRQRQDIPSIAGILRAINKECGFKLDIYPISGPFVYEKFPNNYYFKISHPTGRTFDVVIKMIWPSHTPPYTPASLKKWAGLILGMSLGRF